MHEAYISVQSLIFAHLYPMRAVSLETGYSKWIGKGGDIIFVC